MNFRKCKACGKTVPEGNYCDQCGKPLFVSEPDNYISITLQQVEGGNVRLTLRPDTIVGRKEGPYASLLGGFIYISSRHARITYDEASGWAVEDLGSTNGTYVNEDCLEKGVPHPFDHGDVVDFGTMIFEVE